MNTLSLPARAPLEADAQWLARQLRASRLTVLCGDGGDALSGLLTQGVLPRLQRRASDGGSAAGPPPTALPPWRERRRGPTPDGREASVFFDRWRGPAPRDALLASLGAAARGASGDDAGVAPHTLAEGLARLRRRSGGRVLLVLDRFDDCLTAPPGRDELTALRDEVFEAVNRHGRQAHFLIALRECSERSLGLLRARVRGFDASRRLVPPPTASAPADAGNAPLPALRPARDEALESLLQTYTPALASVSLTELERLAAEISTYVAQLYASEPAPAPAVVAPARNVGRPTLPSPPANARALQPIRAGRATEAPSAPPGAPDIEVSAPPRLATRRPGWGPLLCAAAALSLWAALRAPEPALVDAEAALQKDPPAAGAAAPRPLEPPPLATAPAFELRTASDSGARLAAELAAALQEEGAPAVAPRRSAGWAEDLAALRADGQLAIARYDALRAARSSAAEPRALRIVMPLFVEELMFIVPADSPLRFIHEIEGRRLGTGAQGTARALSARTAYAQLFGAPAPAAAGATDDTAALAELLAGQVDVVVLVGAMPGLPAGTARRLRLLALDAGQAASRRASQALLPARLTTGLDAVALAQPVPTLAVMSFLVTGAAPPGDVTEPALARIARALCRKLPTLQRAGHPKWRELQPGLQLDVGWPYAGEVQPAWRQCVGERRADHLRLPRPAAARDAGPPDPHFKGELS